MRKHSQKKSSYIIFLRHGDHALRSGFYPDHMTMGLSEKGKQQAREAASQLKAFPIDSIVASPLLRSKETAAIIAEAIGLPISIDSRLSERVFPQLSGMRYEAIGAEIGEEKASHLRAGNSDAISLAPSDSLSAYQQQICSCIADYVGDEGQVTLLVSHGGPHDWYLNAVARSCGHLAYQRLFNLGKCRASLFFYSESEARPQAILAVNITVPDALILIREHQTEQEGEYAK